MEIKEEKNAINEEVRKLNMQSNTVELSEDELGEVFGGTTYITVNGHRHPVVTSANPCPVNVFSLRGKPHFWDIKDWLWWINSKNGQCGRCRKLSFKGGIGYCDSVWRSGDV